MSSFVLKLFDSQILEPTSGMQGELAPLEDRLSPLWPLASGTHRPRILPTSHCELRKTSLRATQTNGKHGLLLHLHD